jgi:triosephosphate isomerase (TIM)
MKTYIVANWKENPSSLAEAKKMFREIEKTLPVYKNCISVICPPAVYLTEANVLIKKAQQGVQDVFWHATGAYTGMMSAEMVKSAGANYAIIGHSERREFAGETNEIIQKKIKSALTAGLSVILCVGEKSRENDYIGIVRDQVKEGLRSISARLVANLIITYEPVWAIRSANHAYHYYMAVR